MISRPLSDRLDFGRGRELAENLLDIDLYCVRDKAVVAEDHTQGLVAGQLFNQFFRDTLVEAGDQGVVVDEEHGLVLHRLAADGQRQVHAPID